MDPMLERDAEKLYRSLGELLRVYQFRDRTRICYHDISVTQCYAISALVRLGTISLKELAADLCLDKSTASRVVDSLERKGYVARMPDPEDGRALRLVVTDKGLDLHRRIELDLIGEYRELLADFEPEVREATIVLVAKLARTATERFRRYEQSTSACTIKGDTTR
jgi:DNA-binding MarR family transcriptional regulator